MKRVWCGLAVGITALVSVWVAPSAVAATAADYRQMGLAYRSQERYPEAIAALTKAVELEPDNLSGRVLLGWTQHRAGLATAATATLGQALQLNPFDVPTLNALGIVYLVGGDLGAAVTTHSWAALLKPDNEIAHYNLSLAFERLQQYDWAVATAKAAAKLEPSNPHPLVAEAIAHWGNGDRALAQETMRRAVALDSRYADADFLQYLGEAGFSRDQIERTQRLLATLNTP